MAINRDYIGRTFPAAAPYEVSRVKMGEIADAIGDQNPLYRDRTAAQAAGYADVIAPPTFAIVISMAGAAPAIADPGLGLNYAMVVHGEQRFEYARPLMAGDVVTAQATITDIRDAGRADHDRERGRRDHVGVPGGLRRGPVAVERVRVTDRVGEFPDLDPADLVGRGGREGAAYVVPVDGHPVAAYRVSRCGRWQRQFGQYFFSSSRSGSLRRFLRVM